MLLTSLNFDVKSIIFFPILAKGLFQKLLEEALAIFTMYYDDVSQCRNQTFFNMHNLHLPGPEGDVKNQK